MDCRCFFAASCTLVVASAITTRASADPRPPADDDDVEVQAAPHAPVNAPAAQSSLPPPVATTPAPAPPATRVADSSAETAREIAELRARIDGLEKARADAPTAPRVRSDPPGPPTTTFDGSAWSRVWPRGMNLSGYVQAQYQQNQSSQDQLDANGNPLNQNRFLVRRARVRFDRGWDYAFATIEIDGNNMNGVAFGLRRAEGSLLLRAPDPNAPPRAVLSVGLTDIPFGYELYEPNRARIFLERTTASRAFFPGDTDFGARVAGALGFFRYAVAILDGTPLPDSQPSAAGFDPTKGKDVMARFGVETKVEDDLGIGAGVSFVHGTGFHAGTQATKSTLQWQDTNANGTVDPGEVIGIPGEAATPSKTFGRWALGFDVEARLDTSIGRGILSGEAYVAQNYDRGLVIADPVATGINLREIGGYVSYVQEITPYGLAGFRVDAYNPNGDATQSRAGSLLPVDQTITTWSPLVGAVLPNRARLVFEYDRVVNHQGLDSRGVPTSLREDQWALRLQVEL